MKTALRMLIVIVVLLPPLRVSARTWYIKADGTGDAPTIQAGVDSAAVGDTVLVGPGIYSDTTHVTIDTWDIAVNVLIDKSIHLVGEVDAPGVVIQKHKSNVAVVVYGAGVSANVESIAIRGNFDLFGCIIDPVQEQPAPKGFTEIGVWGRLGDLVVRECAIDSTFMGILVDQGLASIISNQLNGVSTGMFCSQSSQAQVTGNCIYKSVQGIASDGAKVMISNNIIEGEGFVQPCQGISCFGGEAEIRDNRIVNVRFASIQCGVTSAIIENNRIDGAGTGTGVYLPGADFTTVRGNIIYHAEWGIDVLHSRGVTIKHNTFDGVNLGIMCQIGTDPKISANVFARAQGGVFCDDLSTPTIECNDMYQVEYPYYYRCSDQTGVNGNISVDPEFCGIDDSGNYYLQSDSPCAPGNHPAGYDCGVIGALPVNCGTDPAKQHTWGSLKEMYKK